MAAGLAAATDLMPGRLGERVSPAPPSVLAAAAAATGGVPLPAPMWPAEGAAAAGFSGTGDSPRSRRLRTSRTVAGEMPATRATSLSDASGWPVSSSAARRRALLLSSGRILPSRPTRTFDRGDSPVERRRMAATVLAARPAAFPMARSDICGWVSMIRSAATRRSAWVSGRP